MKTATEWNSSIFHEFKNKSNVTMLVDVDQSSITKQHCINSINTSIYIQEDRFINKTSLQQQHQHKHIHQEGKT